MNIENDIARNRALIVVSAEKAELRAEENAQRSGELGLRLFLLSALASGLSILRAKGHYRGHDELSFILVADESNQAENLHALAQSIATDYQQESYLFIAPGSRQAALHFADMIYPVGTFTRVSKEIALAADGYTAIENPAGETEYYTTIKEGGQI